MRLSLVKRPGLFTALSIFLLWGMFSFTGAQDLVDLYEKHLPEIVLRDKNFHHFFHAFFCKKVMILFVRL